MQTLLFEKRPGYERRCFEIIIPEIVAELGKQKCSLEWPVQYLVIELKKLT